MSTGHISNEPSYGSHGSWPVSSAELSSSAPRVQVLLPEQEQLQVKNTSSRKSYSIEIAAGFIVVAIALVVLIVALNVILPGIPQTIVITTALSFISVGGFEALKGIVYKAREVLIFQDSEKLRVKHALGVGVAFAGLGLAMKVSSVFIPSGYNLVFNKIGGFTYDKSSNSLLVTFSHYIYLKFYRSSKIEKGEPLTLEEMRIEAKKLKRIALGLLIVGVAFLVLGILIAVAGHVFVTGVAATVMLATASPIIAVSLSFILQTLLHSSIGQWRIFEEAAKQHYLFVDGKVADIRKEDLSAHEKNRKIPKIHVQSDSSTGRITSKEVSKAIGFSKKQKIILAIATLLLLAGFAAMCVSSFAPLTGLYAYLLLSIGTTLTGIVIPVVSSGVIDITFQLRTRYRISRIRWKEMKEQAAVLNEIKETFGNNISHNQALKVWRLVGKDIINQTEKAIREEIADCRSGRQVRTLLIGSSFIICGVGIMLLALLPILSSVTAGMIGIGGIAFTIGTAFYFRQLVIWLYALIDKLRKRREERRLFLDQVGPMIDVQPQDLIVGGLGDSDHLVDSISPDLDANLDVTTE